MLRERWGYCCAKDNLSIGGVFICGDDDDAVLRVAFFLEGPQRLVGKLFFIANAHPADITNHIISVLCSHF